jgi:hypothetical protein
MLPDSSPVCRIVATSSQSSPTTSGSASQIPFVDSVAVAVSNETETSLELAQMAT